MATKSRKPKVSAMGQRGAKLGAAVVKGPIMTEAEPLKPAYREWQTTSRGHYAYKPTQRQ